ncbi:MAG: hypothetical protein WAW34_19915 [Rhodoferax sp.]
MKLDIQITGLKELQADLNNFSERRLNAAIATALTRTAVQVREKAKSAMLTSLDRPTPYTVRQLKYVAATAAKPVAAVGFGVVGIQDVQGNVIRYQDLGASETPAGKYLSPQIRGGARGNKRFENALRAVGVLPSGWQAVPGARAKIDAYGNQSIGEIRQILSWMDAAELVAGSRQNMGAAGRAKRIKGTRKTAGFEYFVVPAGASRAFVRANGKTGSHKMQPGIYRRTLLAMGSRIEPIIIFVRSTQYRPRFDFYGIAQRESDRILPTELTRAVSESIARMKGAASS